MPHVLNIGKWMTDYRLETLSGEAGKVGHFERVFPSGMGDVVPHPHYHLYGIAEIVPKRCVALEVLREKGGSYGYRREGMTFEVILLADVRTATVLTFLVIDVQMGKGWTAEDEAWMEEDGVARDRLNRYFETLRQQVHAAANSATGAA